MRSVAYSADGSRLARAEGNAVVVCDAVSGFEVHRLKGQLECELCLNRISKAAR